ncbi:ATP-binding protein [Aeromonas hydrophila]|uniref:ATP-binding protein n=1 Tax=Aeromonas hydrophila TaxID=644 RepID=UPI001C5884C4|nr:ATP-binding protein [Aeromonas hydrophila]
MSYRLEDIFKTEGVPEFTFVRPPNYNDILVDIRNPTKPVIIEGQSGSGKTTVAKKIIELAFGSNEFTYLSARKAQDFKIIHDISEGQLIGKYIVDDFHRLDNETQEKIANVIKVAAEDSDESSHPKIVIIGINRVGSELIRLVHDISRRCGIHRVQPASPESINELIEKGEGKLNIKIGNHHEIYRECAGDYWLAQLLC